MPIAGYIAAFFVYPVCGDYVFSLTLITAVIVSALIIWYVVLVQLNMKKFFQLSHRTAWLLGLLFLLFHFIVFSHKDTPIPFLFNVENFTCVYFYLIPALLNSIVVLLILNTFYNIECGRMIADFFSRANYELLFLAVYLAIFSNLFQNIILISFVSVILLLQSPWQKGFRTRNLISYILLPCRINRCQYMATGRMCGIGCMWKIIAGH